MGFSFDLEDGEPGSLEGPRVRTIHAPRFSASVGRTRPALDSEPEPDAGPSPETLDEEAPLDFPFMGASAPDPRETRRPRELLGAIRSALRQGAPPRPVPRSSEVRSAAPAAHLRQAPLSEPHSGKPSRKFIGPLAALAALGLTYVLSTSSLVALGPRLARSSPRVPDLGSLGAKARTSEPGPSPSLAAPATATPAPVEQEPLIETGPLPEGLPPYPGKGLIEVVTSERELIYVDSIFLGRGPLRRVPVLPGEHAIKIRSGGTEKDTSAVVHPAKTTRVHFESDPHFVGPDGTKADPEELD